MPTIEENLKEWNQNYDWRLAGEPWSKAWGSTAAQWYGCIYPRIRRFLPSAAILEIAPGYGRWTAFLLEYCETLIGVDLSPRCVEGCMQRFADRPGASFATNDGCSLPVVADSSIDFAFSFDSLVHVEVEALNGYLTELSRILRPDGVAFLHHSNLGAYQRTNEALAPLQGAFKRIRHTRLRTGLVRIGVDRALGWRASTVSAATLADLASRAGLSCVSQELINWSGGVLLVDSISVLTQPGSRWDRPNRVVKNRLFRSEARSIRLSDSLYDRLPLTLSEVGMVNPVCCAKEQVPENSDPVCG